MRRPKSRGSPRSASSPIATRERLEKLATTNSIAANQLDEARAQVVQLTAQLRQVEVRVRSAEYDLEQTEVHAPFPGIVSERLATRGEYVAAGAAIVHLVDTTNLEASVQAPLALAVLVKPDMKLPVRIGDREFKASVRAVVPVGEEHSRQFELRLALSDNPPMVGSAIEVALPEREVAETLAVPRDALIVREDGSYVMRIKADNTAERVEVKAGASDGELTAVSGAFDGRRQRRRARRGAPERRSESAHRRARSGRGGSSFFAARGLNELRTSRVSDNTARIACPAASSAAARRSSTAAYRVPA